MITSEWRQPSGYRALARTQAAAELGMIVFNDTFESVQVWMTQVKHSGEEPREPPGRWRWVLFERALVIHQAFHLLAGSLICWRFVERSNSDSELSVVAAPLGN